MKKSLLVVMALVLGLTTSCKKTMNENPLLAESKNNYGAYQFDEIQKTDYIPAFEAAIAQAREEVSAIIRNEAEPDFENTVEALENAGKKLDKVSSIFYFINSADTDSTMQAIAEEVSPKLTEFEMFVSLNDTLFQKIKKVWEKRESLNLNQEQARLLSETFKSFERNGANLSPEDKAKLSEVETQLSLATLSFGKNSLLGQKQFELNVVDSTQITGLPASVLELAASEAKTRNQQGWTFTLDNPSYSPFMKYCDNRDLRKKMVEARGKACQDGEFSNLENILTITRLRNEKAHILGYKTFAAFATSKRMAKTQENVEAFLADLTAKTMPFAKKEIAQIQAYANEHGFEGQLQSWDVSYWAEKYKNEKFSLNEEELKPYFLLDNVQAAIFDLAGRLYGLKFEEDKSIPVYHPDVRAFKVTEADGTFKALLYIDFFVRDSKQSGAWMSDLRGTSIQNGVENRPFVGVVTNFSKATETTPALLRFDDVTTILHEFGHALHGMLAEGTYGSITGTNVAWDFVELPSQIMENWAYEPEFLKTFAKHYQTGEVIPQELIDKIVEAKNFMAAYYQLGQLKYGLIDMAWYSSETPVTEDPVAFETKVLKDLMVVPTVSGVASSPTFGHIFKGGYAAGYYSYKWAEVLEADAFSLFKEKGIFNREVARSFRDNILSKGNLEDADVLYRNFRGRDPEPDALLVKLGLK